MAKLREQPDRRRYQVFIDQHGRKWGATIEVDSGGPTGPVQPQFKAPYIPAPQHLTFSRTDTSVLIDYDAAIRDREDALKGWMQALTQFAHGTLGQKAGEGIKNPTPDMLAYAGPKPLPVEFPAAARAGNKWVLGLVDAVPDWALSLLPAPKVTEQAFPDADYADADDDSSKPAKRRKATA